jgi:hypothetical protein
MTLDPDRERLGATFDRSAAFYQRARPDYPIELLDTFTGHIARRDRPDRG